MQIAILILKRSQSMPKAEWRLPATRRTLASIEIASQVTSAWTAWRAQPESPALVICELETESAGSKSPGLKTNVVRKAKNKDHYGALELAISGENVKLKLNGAACQQQVYQPRRKSEHLASLQFWEPVRVLLNGKADWSSGRFYYLQDYHVVLCNETMPAHLPEPRLIDLQADLY